MGCDKNSPIMQISVVNSHSKTTKWAQINYLKFKPKLLGKKKSESRIYKNFNDSILVSEIEDITKNIQTNNCPDLDEYIAEFCKNFITKFKKLQ